jgi:hypothetical protein
LTNSALVIAITSDRIGPGNIDIANYHRCKRE